jgi:hypothetical protein
VKLFPSKIVVNPSSESAALAELNAMIIPASATMRVCFMAPFYVIRTEFAKQVSVVQGCSLSGTFASKT